MEHERGTTFTTRAEAKAEIDRRWGTLHREGDTLQRERAALAAAAQAQARHEHAVTAAAEHDGRGAALHRLLSAEARAARAAARRDLDQAEREVRATGAHDRAALAQRERALRPRELAYWRQRDVLEPLAAARAAITRVDREHARQERERSPGYDRGDDFGR